MKTILKNAFQAVLGLVFFPIFFILCLIITPYRLILKKSGHNPNIAFGPIAIINNIHNAKALRHSDFTGARSIIFKEDRIISGNSYDIVFNLFGNGSFFKEFCNQYFCFFWVFLKFDIFFFYYNGAYLQGTLFERLEMPLYRLFGKKTIFFGYGSDIAVLSHMGPIRRCSEVMNPSLITNEQHIIDKVDYFSKYASLCVRNIQPGYVPRYDALMINFLGIDKTLFSSDSSAYVSSARADRGDTIKVVHASNHRIFKGTDEIISAVKALNEEGFKIELELIEKKPNEEVRKLLNEADIVIEQFHMSYGMFAIEGLAAGRAVISRMDWIKEDVRNRPPLNECPIFHADLTSLKDAILLLANDPELRMDLAEKSIKYVDKYHNLNSVGRDYAALVNHVWSNTPLPQHMKPIETNEKYNYHYSLEP